MDTKKKDNPDWAPPPSLLEYRESFADNLDHPLSAEICTVIDKLCSSEMKSVWSQIDRRAIHHDYHKDFALEVFKALRTSPVRQMTPAEFRRKRTQAAVAAQKLKALLEATGLGKHTVFPALGTEAVSGVVNYFLQGQDVILPDDGSWGRELETLNATLVTNSPGVGSWDALLNTLITRLESPDDRFWPEYRATKGIHPEAVNFVASIGPYIEQLCGQPLLGTISNLTAAFFPNMEFSNASITQILSTRRKS